MTKLTEKRNIFYATITAIVIVAAIITPAETYFAPHLAQAASEQNPPGPYFPPTPEFTSSEMDKFVANAKNVPGIKAWSDKWQLGYLDFNGVSTPTPQWNQMIMHLHIPSDTSAPKACDIGWESIVVFDLATKSIVKTYAPDNSTPCHRESISFSDPDLSKDSVESNAFLPIASATVAHNGYSSATQDDILGPNILQGTIANIYTPTFSGTYTHMSGFVAQLVNARFSPTAGQDYAQGGWIIAHYGCSTSCGDLVQANSKVITWADNSVTPFTLAPHVFGYPSPPAWTNGQVETSEVLCSGSSNYKIQASYGSNLYVHTTGVPCTGQQYGSEITNSVYVENNNTMTFTSWPSDITSAVKADSANEKLNGVWNQWQTSSDKDLTCGGSVVSPSTAMTGNIKLGGTATWGTLSNVPYAC
ncbi:MAG: hypothetical protein KGH87_02095 [Thaumarchaeota archaeon]|nr:hypothetical protein [Nitrososphaerota archaeon]MDE1838689.1 hypothetical protein [Nitrososphaerota archaeon]